MIPFNIDLGGASSAELLTSLFPCPVPPQSFPYQCRATTIHPGAQGIINALFSSLVISFTTSKPCWSNGFFFFSPPASEPGHHHPSMNSCRSSWFVPPTNHSPSSSQTDYIIPLLKTLSWLPMTFGRKFKFLPMVFSLVSCFILPCSLNAFQPLSLLLFPCQACPLLRVFELTFPLA